MNLEKNYTEFQKKYSWFHKALPLVKPAPGPRKPQLWPCRESNLGRPKRNIAISWHTAHEAIGAHAFIIFKGIVYHKIKILFQTRKTNFKEF